MSRRLLIVGLSALLLQVTAASAHLGGDAASTQSDGELPGAVVAQTSFVQYDMHEITTGTGLRIREFARRDGAVFAVGWSGPVPPDLQLLLGDYFHAYAAALAALDHAGLHRSVRIVLPQLVVESSGHLRAYQGRAYLPAMVPTGVTLAELQ